MDQIKIMFEDDGLSVSVAPGAKLVDVCDEHAVSVLFGCRQANCGTCLIEVTQGGESISSKTQDEDELLEVLAPENPRARLGCQCIVNGDIRIRVLDD